MIALASALVVVLPGTAHAVTFWSTTGKTGVHAQGEVHWRPASVSITGYVKDTRCGDKRAALLQFVFRQPGGGSGNDDWESFHTLSKPCKTTVHITGLSGISRDRYFKIEVRECLATSYQEECAELETLANL
ncbi:hypothetical protein [Spongiactinospora sp. 9N601]|uniref:hypothetical protein n=1 Tax=Spongiactinospora sp. 9N601 TaxID=3375149 RepID=UPI0037A5DEB8